MVSCERSWEVDALREGRLTASDAESFERHMRTCAVCRSQFAEDERLRELGQALEPLLADEVSVRRMRANLLRAANAPVRAKRGRWLVLAAAMMASAIALTWFELRPRTIAVSAPAATAFVGSVTGDGRFTQARVGDEERVALLDGRVTVHVQHLGPNERFVVQLPDGELEVRGTTFEVTVAGGSTQSVKVTEGRVALRLDGFAAMLLAAGDGWSRPAESPPVASASATATTSAATVAPMVAPHAHLDASADAYEEAMRAYRNGEFEQAAPRFRAFAAQNPLAPEAEDAAYLEALSLARAGHRDAAGATARVFLQRFPSSFHRKEAALLVARSAVAQGDCASAQAVLAPIGADEDTKAALGACVR